MRRKMVDMTQQAQPKSLKSLKGFGRSVLTPKSFCEAMILRLLKPMKASSLKLHPNLP